jgi:cellulose biosynthesis protein BcsQ
MGEIVTFYSYKGGTGRSMALANVAHILAWRIAAPGKKVLAIDWDLEAPGLHKFFIDQLKGNFSVESDSEYADALSQKSGLIDFLYDVQNFYKSKYSSGGLAANQARTEAAVAAFNAALAAHPLSKYILAVQPPKELAYAKADRPGVFLMKAGSQGVGKKGSPDYIGHIRNFDWVGFYENYGSFFTLFREQLAAEYDVVLIDSRTGLTDIGDICTRVMPETLVAVFAPNEQNIEGLIDIVKSAAEYRLNSRDPRGLMVYPLASRIDATASRLRKIWWEGGRWDGRDIVGYEQHFERLFRSIYRIDDCDLHDFFDNTQVPYDSDYAFGERVAARDQAYDRLSIGRACENLTRYLVDDIAPWEPLAGALTDAGSSTTSATEIETLLQALSRYLWPTWLALAGIVLAISGAFFDTDSGPLTGVPIPNSNIRITYPSAIRGFGAEVGRLSFSPLTSDFAPIQLLFSIDQGIIDPNGLLLSPSTLAQPVTVTSVGFGNATLAVNASPDRSSPTQNNVAAPLQQLKLNIKYFWPASLFASIVGGVLLGMALRLWNILRSPFALPTLSVLAMYLAFDSVAILGLVVVYIFLLVPLLTVTYTFHLVAIFLAVSFGPWALLQSISVNMRRLSTTRL